MALVNAFRASIVGHEGAFGTRLLEWNMIEPSLTFGRAGIVDANACVVATRQGSACIRTGLSDPYSGQASSPAPDNGLYDVPLVL